MSGAGPCLRGPEGAPLAEALLPAWPRLHERGPIDNNGQGVRRGIRHAHQEALAIRSGFEEPSRWNRK